MMPAMSTPKLKKMLVLLCEIEAEPRSKMELSKDMGLGTATVARLVQDLRGLGCRISTTEPGRNSRYVLSSWGVFDPLSVKTFLGVK